MEKGTINDHSLPDMQRLKNRHIQGVRKEREEGKKEAGVKSKNVCCENKQKRDQPGQKDGGEMF